MARSSRSDSIKPKHWWQAGNADACRLAFEAAGSIARQQQTRRSDDSLFMRMYGNDDVAGQGKGSPSASESSTNGLDRLRFNLVRSVVNTAAAHIASKRPKPKFQTNDADWGLTRNARACELAIKGIFEANGYYDLARACFTDAGVSSLGSLYVYSEYGVVRIEKCFPGELLVDAREGYYGNPLTIYRIRPIDRACLRDTYDLTDDDLKSSGDGKLDDALFRQFRWLSTDIADQAEQALLLQAWRLGPRGEDGKRKGGKYLCAVAGKTIELEDWDRERLPFAHFRWERRQFGFAGCGIVEELRNHQRALNYLHQKIGDIMHKNSRSNIVLFDGAGGKASVNVQHIDNDPATIIRVRNGGQQPVVAVHNAVPTELLAYRREIIQDGYAQIGLSQLRATGQLPQGIESGAAIREVNDSSSQRWQTKVQDYETLALEVARICVDELANMDERAPIRTTVRKGGLTAVQQIDWGKHALEDNEYELSLTPASALPDSTAGRTQTVQDWMASGLITTEEAKALLDFPDIDRYQSLDLSAHEVCLDTIERIIEDGEYNPPEPTDDLLLCVKLATQSYNRFRLRRAPEDRLALLLQYLDDLRHLIEMAKQGAPQPAAAPGAPAAMAPAAMAQPQPQGIAA